MLTSCRNLTVDVIIVGSIPNEGDSLSYSHFLALARQSAPFVKFIQNITSKIRMEWAILILFSLPILYAEYMVKLNKDINKICFFYVKIYILCYM